MDWFKKHVDTVIVLGGLFAGFLWINGKFNDMERKLDSLKNEISIVKTVLIIKGIFPTELASNVKEKEG